MKIYCKRCNPTEIFKIPEFSTETKKKLITLRVSSPLLAIQEMRNSYNISHKKGKFITAHLNVSPNKCHRCETSLQQEEYVSCPKCNSLNLNWNVKF